MTSSHLAIIINKQAKNASQASEYLDYFTAQGIDYHLHEIEPEQLYDVLKVCCEQHQMIIIGGGDGSVRTAAQFCANQHLTLGVLPVGTLNHFAKELNLPVSKEDLATAILEHSTQKIDLAEVNGYIFVNNSSLGFYPKFAQKRDYYTKYFNNKWLSYIPSIIEALKRHETYMISVKSKDLNLTIRTSFFMISNNVYSYEFPISIKRESFNNTKLGIYYFRHGRLRLLKILRLLLNKKKNFIITDSDTPITISILNKTRVTISIDGDTLETTVPLVYKNIPNSLTVLTRSS